MLYTTYFNKMNLLPNDVKKLIIVRFLPKWFDITKYTNTFIVKEFAPYEKTLLDYKKDGDWGKYTERFNRQMKEDKKMAAYLDRLALKLLQGYNYALICYEKDYTYCHRYLIAKYLETKGIEWEEL